MAYSTVLHMQDGPAGQSNKILSKAIKKSSKHEEDSASAC